MRYNTALAFETEIGYNQNMTKQYEFNEIKDLPLDIVSHMNMTGTVHDMVYDMVIRYQRSLPCLEGKHMWDERGRICTLCNAAICG